MSLPNWRNPRFFVSAELEESEIFVSAELEESEIFDSAELEESDIFDSAELEECHNYRKLIRGGKARICV